ncbi:MAG: Ig-like domain-containing protein, partial [bacterium]
MRQRLRAVGLFALAIVAITCTDAPTSPNKVKSTGSGVANIRMSPSFSPEAARIYSGLAAFGFEITEVHVVLTGPDGSTKDTVIAFPASQDQITIEIPVPSSGTDQVFDALIELRNDQHIVLFSGHQSVIARAANLPPVTPPLVVISYTGPGKGTKTVTFSPPDTTIAGTATVAIKAAAVDSAGLPVPNLLVQFAVSDVTLAVVTSTGDATGTLTGLGKRGVAVVSAITPLGVTGSSRITFVPAAARVIVISGGGQTGVAGSALAQPLVVEVQATDNLPVPGAAVTFRAVTAGGSVQQATAVADGNGRASTTLTLGLTTGLYAFEAGSGALTPVSVTATATPSAAAAIAIVSGDAQTDTVGRTLLQPLVVKVTDQFGGPTAAATVTWTRIAGNGTPSASSTTTAADGTTSITYLLGATASNDTIRASVAGVAQGVLFSAKAVTRSAATIAIISGGNQSGAPNSTLPTALVARVSDAQNNPIANAVVTWSAAGAGAAFNPASSATDALGQVTTQATLGATAGSTTVTATVGTVTATTTLTTTGGGGGGGQTTLSIVAGDNQSALAGAAVPVAPSVLLKDGSGNPVASSQIVFTVLTGGGAITGGTATTNASGVATLGSWTLGTAPGPNTLQAAFGSLSVTFSATGTAPSATKLLITQQPSATVVNSAAFPQQPVVQLTDAQGNPISTAGVVITATFASGPTSPAPVLSNATATTSTGGQATFSGMSINGAFGVYSLSFGSQGVTPIVSNTITVGAGPANTLILLGGNGQSAPAGTAVAVPPLAKVIDAQSNGVPGVVVTFNAVTAGSTVSNGTTTGTTVTVTTNALGIAQLTAWTLSATAGPQSLTASASVPNGSPVTFNATATTSTASKFVLVQPLPQQIAVGAAIPAIEVQITDANNNPVAQANVSVNLNGNVQPSGNNFNVTLQTDARGIASFTLSPYVGPVGNMTLTFTGTGFTTLTSSPIPVVAGAPAALRMASQPSTSAQSGVALPAQPSVQLLDAGLNAVTTAGIAITATVGGATLGGTTTVNTNASGVAVFTNLSLTGPLGQYTLLFTSPSLNSVTSGSIDLIAGAAASMSIAAGNGQSAPAGSNVPVLPAVLVKDAGGNPVAGVAVTFTAVTQGSLIDDVITKTIPTNAQGIAVAQVFWMLSPTAGPNTLTAAAAGVAGSPLTFTANGTAGGAASIQLLQAVPASITVGQPFPAPVQVQIVDQNNNPVQQGGVVITATANVQPSNTTFSLNATTAGNGIATFAPPTYVGKIGTLVFTLSAPGINSLVTPGITVLTGAANNVVINTQPPATAASGVAFTPQPDVQITDVGSNPVNGAANVVATIASGSGTLGGTTTITSNASGHATFSNLSLSGAPGSFTLRFSSASLTPAVSNTIALGAGGPAAIVINAGNGQVVAAGTTVPIPPSVRVNDGSGNPISGVTVTFAAVFGGGSVTGATAVTNGSGIATVGTWTLGTAAGTNNVTATAGALTATFQATGVAGPATKLALTTPPSATASSGSPLAQQPAVQRQDQFGNPVQGSGVVVTASVLTGSGTLTNATATTSAAGLATFSGLTITGTAGTVTLDFTSAGVTHIASGNITVGGGTAAAIAKSAGDGQTAAVGTNVAIAPSVLVTDGAGNPVAGVPVTFAPTLGGGSTPGGSVLTNASGIATAISWRLGTSTGTNNLLASAGALSTTFTATAVAGPPNQLIFVNPPPPTATSGVPLSVQPAVQRKDQFGNNVNGGGILVTASILTGSGTLTNATATTNAGGLAIFTGVTITGTAGTFTLDFNSAGVTHVASGGITLSGGSAATIAKSAGDGQTAAAGTNVA